MVAMVATLGLTVPALPLQLYPHNTAAAVKDRRVEAKVLLQQHKALLVPMAVLAVTG